MLLSLLYIVLVLSILDVDVSVDLGIYMMGFVLLESYIRLVWLLYDIYGNRDLDGLG